MSRDKVLHGEPKSPAAPLRHFGALDESHLVLAITAIERDGPEGDALDAIAEQIPGTRRYLFTTLAGDGYNALARTLERASAANGGDLFNALLAYITFALDHQAYFDVMARPELYDCSDPVVRIAQGLAMVSLVPPARRTVGDHDVHDVVRVAWTFTQRFARHWAGGAFDRILADPSKSAAFAVAVAHGGVYSVLRQRFPYVRAIERIDLP